MGLSLNSEEREIVYDTNIDYFIDLYNFAGELVFSFALPEILFHISDVYCVDVQENTFDNPMLSAERKVIIAGTRNWITRKDKDGRPNIINTSIFSSMIIAIEVKKDEFKNVRDLFYENEDALQMKVRELLQNALEVVLYRYNEKAGGKSFLTPSYLDCDRVEVAFNQNLIGKRITRCYYRIYDFKLTRDSEESISIEAFNEPVNNWRYFFNKSQYELMRKKYVDSIISAAISVEAYSWGIVRDSFVEEETINEYASEEKDGKKTFLSATKLYKKLVDDGRISTNMSKTQLDDHIQKILNPRNDIMHGKRSIVGSWKSEAERSNKMIKEMFSSFGVDISEDLFWNKGNQNSEIVPYKNYVLRCLNEQFDSLNVMLEISEQIAKEYPEMEFPKVYMAKALFAMQQNEQAMHITKEIMSRSKNQSAIAIELWYSLRKQFGSEIEQIMELVDEKDERAYTLLAYVNYNRFSSSKIKSRQILLEALNYTQKAYNIDSKYITNVCLMYNILKELGNDEYIEIAKEITDSFVESYMYPIFCSYYVMRAGNIEDALQYFSVFIDRFENYHYKGISFDLFSLECPVENILKMAEEIICFLEQKDVDNIMIANYKKRLDDCRKLPLTSYINKEKIFRYGVEGMPQGNIVYGRPLNVAQGYHILR